MTSWSPKMTNPMPESNMWTACFMRAGNVGDMLGDSKWAWWARHRKPMTHRKGFHDLIGANEPRGWHTQLPDEPVINLGYTVAHLAAAGHAGGLAEWRIVPVGNVGLGTYFTGEGLGIYGEVGWNLVDAFGGAALRVENHFTFATGDLV